MFINTSLFSLIEFLKNFNRTTFFTNVVNDKHDKTQCEDGCYEKSQYVRNLKKCESSKVAKLNTETEEWLTNIPSLLPHFLLRTALSHNVRDTIPKECLLVNT
jgi:hypothetical protein